MRKISVWVSYLLVCVLIIMCISIEVGLAQENKKILIGCSHRALRDEHSVQEELGVRAACEARGVDLIFLDAEGDMVKQNDQILSLLTMKVDAMLIFPEDRYTVLSAVKEVSERGIPIVGFDAAFDGADLFIAFDNAKAAEKDAEFIAQKLIEKYGEPKGIVLEIIGPLSMECMQERMRGFSEGMKKYPNIDIIAKGVEASIEKTADITDTLLIAYGDKLDAIFLTSDYFFPGVFSSLQRLGRDFKVGHPKHVIIASIDAQPMAMEKIREGYMDCTAAQYPYKYGELAVDWALRLLNKEEIPIGKVIEEPGLPWSPMRFVSSDTGPRLYLNPVLVPIEISADSEYLYAVRALKEKGEKK